MKGQLYILEVSIAILMILSFIIFLFLNPSASPEYNIMNYKTKAYEGLETLEQTGKLRRYVADNNATAINESLNPYIPSFLSRAVVIYNDTNSLTTETSLSDKNESISVSYFLAGDFDDYKAREVRVYMWGPVISTWLSTTTTAVETGGNVGAYSSIAIDSQDKVHISHSNSTDYNIRYCNNINGWTCTYVETDAGVSSYSSIAIDSQDKVHISYKNTSSLMYCNNTLGTWTCTDVETGTSIGWKISIAIDSQDKAHISHGNNTLETLRYCNNTLGTWTCMEVGTGHGGRESSIAIDSQDKVHISHASSMDPGLKYCNNTLGTWTCMEVETGISGIGDTSIAIDSNDKIHISYYNETGTTAASGDLVYCNNTLGSWTCTAVETYGYIGYSTSIAIDSNDKPHISHYDGIFEALRYCYTSNFSTWNYRKVDDTGGSITTNGRAIAIKKGRLCDSTSFSSSVHISYYNPTTDDLMYAKIEEQYSYGRL